MKKVLFLAGAVVVLLSAVGCKEVSSDTATPKPVIRPECKDGVCPVQKVVPEVPTVQGQDGQEGDEAAYRPFKKLRERRHKKAGE